MTNKIEVREGNLEIALLQLLEYGGQIFPGRHGRDGISWVCGNKHIIFWNEKSQKYAELQQMAKELNYPEPELVTGGKLVRHLLAICDIDYKSTYFHPYWQKLAREGQHWHYQHIDPGQHGLCFEIDIKSAYWSSFEKLPSIFLATEKSFIPDGGKLKLLSNIMRVLPKSFRLQFLGTLASHKMHFYKREKIEGKWQIKFDSRNNISYGSLFNSAHKAILSTFQLMQSVHKMHTSCIKRIHTDSFLIEDFLQGQNSLEIMKYLAKQGYDTSCKKYGKAYLKDLNCGFIGRFPIGSKKMALDYARSEGLKISLKNSPEEEELIKLYKEIIPFPII